MRADKKNLIILAAAFAAIYIVWGSTYLAIKYAIETLPPFIMAGARFLIAGGILFALSFFTKDFEMPTRRHWRTSLIVGTLLLLGGNGGVVFAEKYISSGLAALLIASEPFWIVMLSWLWLRSGRPTGRVIGGLLLGFLGVGMLVVGVPGGAHSSDGYQMAATIAIILAALSWAAGSIYGLKAPVPKSALLTAGMQMLAGGLVLMLVSFPKGEWNGFSISEVSTVSWIGLVYLIIFGSLIGFTAYSWLLKNAEPSMVATYAYVNPVVAVLLGWWIAGESLTGQMFIGALFVVGSVVLVTIQKKERHALKETEVSMTPGFSAST